MLNIRRAEFITNMMRDSEQLSENGDEPDEDFGARHPRASLGRLQATDITAATNRNHAQELNRQNRSWRISPVYMIQLVAQ